MPSPRSPTSTLHDIGMEPDDVSTAIADSLSIMFEQERTTYACHDYFKTNSDSPQEHEQQAITKNNNIRKGGKEITPDDRQKVVDWCYDIVDRCQLNRETVAVAMNMVDRYMSTPSPRQDNMLHHRGQYQLLIITALYVSIKINEPVLFSSAEFAEVTHGAYSMMEIEDMERTLLHGLKWRLCIPTPQKIASHIIELLEVMMYPRENDSDYDNADHKVLNGLVSSSTWEFLREEVAFQTQNSVRDFFFSLQRSSTVAAIAILNAIEQVNDVDYEPLMKNMICILKMLDFVDASTLLYSRHRLRALVNEHEEDEESSSSTSSCSEERTQDAEVPNLVAEISVR